MKKEMIFCQRVVGCFCCGADRVSARSPRSFERRRPPRRRRPERCVSFSFIAVFEVMSCFGMGGALRGTNCEGRPGATGRRMPAPTAAQKSAVTPGNRRETPHVGSSGPREAERGSRPGFTQAPNGARSQVAEGKGEKTQDGSQHAHGSQTGGKHNALVTQSLQAHPAADEMVKACKQVRQERR